MLVMRGVLSAPPGTESMGLSFPGLRPDGYIVPPPRAMIGRPLRGLSMRGFHPVPAFRFAPRRAMIGRPLRGLESIGPSFPGVPLRFTLPMSTSG